VIITAPSAKVVTIGALVMTVALPKMVMVGASSVIPAGVMVMVLMPTLSWIMVAASSL
jgi:hypothetical protein